MIRFPLLVLVIAWLAQAQPLENRAHLRIEVLANGSQRATLTSTSGNTPNGLSVILSRAIGCNTVATDHEGDSQISVQCKLQRPAPLSLHFNAQLTELINALGSNGVGSLEILITAEAFGWTRTNADIAGSEASSYYTKTYLLSEVPSSIELEAGFANNSLYFLAAGVVGILLLPCLLLVARPKDVIQLQATVQCLILFGCAGWICVLQQSQAFALCTFLFPQWMFAPLFALTMPPLLAVWVGSSFLAAHYARLTPTSGRAHLQLRFWMGATLACGLSGFASLLCSPCALPEPFLSIIASLTPTLLCLARLVQLARGDSLSLPEGELRARLFNLAEHAGVRLRGITLLTSIEPKPPVALAARWGVVILNESLLRSFSKREVDAIVCHELSHINATPRGAMPNGRITVVWFLITGAILAAQFVKAVADCAPLLLLAAYFIFKVWRRREECKADLDSVRWNGDAEGLIMGISRMSYANNIPLEWAAPFSWFLSHPSTMERLKLIARAGGVSASRMEELLAEARFAPVETYPFEQAAREEAAFAPSLRQTLQTRLMWFGLAAPIGITLPVVWFMRFAGLEGWRLFALATPLAIVVFYIIFEWIAGSVRSSARRRAITKYGEGTFVGFTPCAKPRVYNKMIHYDFGMLRTSSQSVEFAGDRLRFTVDRRLVSRIWIDNGARHYTPRRVVCIEYRPSPDAPLAVFSVQSFDAALWPNTESAVRRLFQEFEIWLRATSNMQAPPEPCNLPTDRGEPDAALSFLSAIKYASTHFGIAFLLDYSFGATLFERNWNPLHPFVPALVTAVLAIFIASPKLRMTTGGARAIRKAEAN